MANLPAPWVRNACSSSPEGLQVWGLRGRPQRSLGVAANHGKLSAGNIARASGFLRAASYANIACAQLALMGAKNRDLPRTLPRYPSRRLCSLVASC